MPFVSESHLAIALKLTLYEILKLVPLNVYNQKN